MPDLLFNYNASDGEGAEPLPKAVYPAVIDTSKSEVGETDAGTYVTISFIISEPNEFSGRRLTVRYYLHDKAVWKWNKFLYNLGIAPDKDGQSRVNTDMLNGLPCKISVKPNTNKSTGKTYNDVDDVFATDDTLARARAKKTSNF